jgi:hypothetical protein
MATSGTTTFNLDISEIMEEAYDLCGLELRSGYSYRSAKRAMNLVFLEWQNKGLKSLDCRAKFYNSYCWNK